MGRRGGSQQKLTLPFRALKKKLTPIDYLAHSMFADWLYIVLDTVLGAFYP